MPIPLPELPSGNTTICLVIPDSAQWRQIYMGALLLLQQWWYYDTNNADGVEEIIQRVMDCHYQTSQNYEGCMELDCNDVANCIITSEAVQNAIMSLVANNTQSNSRNSGQSQGNYVLGAGANPTCDLDVLWGGIRYVVESANDNNIDALQIFESLTNINEWIAQVAGGIFGVELPIAQSMLDWALYIQDNVLEVYEAIITQEYLEELQCGLFCLTKDTCELTPQIIVDYFYGRLSSVLTFDSLINETLEFVFFGTWSGTELADVMFLSQLAFRAQLGKWFDFIGFNSIDLDFALGANTPDNDWILLCTDCPSFITIPFEEVMTDDYDLTWIPYTDSAVTYSRDGELVHFSFGNPLPSYRAGFGTTGANHGISGYVRIDFATEKNVYNVAFDYWYKQPANNILARSIELFDADDILLDSWSTSANDAPKNSWQTLSQPFDVADVAYIIVEIRIMLSTGTTANTDAYIDNVVITI